MVRGIKNSLLSAAEIGLRSSGNDLGSALQRLTLGQRTLSNDTQASTQGLYDRLGTDAAVYRQSAENGEAGLAATTVVTDALEASAEILDRLQDVATAAAVSGISGTQRAELQEEGVKLVNEYNRILRDTTFNSSSLLTTTTAATKVQFGQSSNGQFSTVFNTDLLRTTQSGFSSAMTLSDPSLSGSGIYDGTFGDIDNDGDLDAIVSDFGLSYLTVFLTDGNELPQPTSGVATGGSATAAELADINGDGNTDLLVSVYDSGFGITYLQSALGDGAGNFGAFTTFSVEADPIIDFATGDFDNDGSIDVMTVSTYTTTSTVKLFTNDGFGNLSEVNSLVSGDRINSIDAGYVDGDSEIDYLLRRDDRTLIYEGDPLNPTDAGRFDGFFMQIGNLDGLSGNEVLTDSGEIIRFDDGYVTYEILSDASLSPGGIAVAAGDFNGDSLTDILDSNGRTYFSNGLGGFDAPTEGFYIPGGAFDDFRVQDANGDGLTDVLLISEGNVGAVIGANRTSTSRSLLNLQTFESATTALDTIQTYQDAQDVAEGRAEAAKSALERTSYAFEQIAEEYTTGAARITNFDEASAIADAVSAEIRLNRATALYAQANVTPAAVVTLLRASKLAA